MPQEFLVKSEDISCHGEYPGSRPIDKLIRNGLIVLDKWTGPTSHDVSSQVKKIFGLKKVGHAGTLDPQVTGVLPVMLENSVKVMPALQKQDKEYVGIMKLHKDTEEEKFRDVAKKFVGSITQMPPVRSAVARKERKRTVYSFDVLEKNGRDALFRTCVEAGTYIRAICHTIGKEIGGAHMSELRRTRAGRFVEQQAVKMQDVVDAYVEWKENGDERIRELVLPVEAATENAKKIIVKDSAVYSIARGSPLYAGGISKAEEGIALGERIALLTLRGELAAIGVAQLPSGQMIKGKKLAVRIDRVIIDQSIYPKM